MADKIDIEIDAKVLYQMYEYAAYAKHLFGTEIAGWGHFTKDKGIYKLAPLPKQIVSGAEVDTFPDEIMKNQTYDISDMTVQWHSHVDMGVTPSWTDKKLIKDAMELYSYLISIIVNCKHQYYAELNIRRSGEMQLPTPIQLEVNLIPYYDNRETEKIVKKQCKKPAPIVVANRWHDYDKTYTQPSNGNRQWGWNPHWGMGTYVGNDFYPGDGSVIVKNVNWNPLKNIYSRDTKGEEVVKIETVEAKKNQTEMFTGKDDLDYFPTAQEIMNGEVIPATGEEEDVLYTEYDMKQIEKRAIKLDKARGKEFQFTCSGNHWWIVHLKSQAACEIDSEEETVYVDGYEGEWNDFLKKVGALEEEFWYSPGDCVACDATGRSSKSKVCVACEGTGKIKVNA